MQHKFENGIEDVAMAIASGRGIRDNGPYGILIGDERLNYRGVSGFECVFGPTGPDRSGLPKPDFAVAPPAADTL